MSRSRLLLACGVLLVLFVFGTIVAIVAQWPAQFGGAGDPDEVATEFLSRGTALSPPLAPIVLFAVFTALAIRHNGWGTAGVVGVMLLSIVFIIGSLGEAFAPSTPDVPSSALITSGVVGTVLSLSVLILGTLTLAEKRREKQGIRPAGLSE